MTHPCPFTAGDLLALGAITKVRAQADHRPDGAARLARMCFEHARLHDADIEREGAEDEQQNP